MASDVTSRLAAINLDAPKIFELINDQEWDTIHDKLVNLDESKLSALLILIRQYSKFCLSKASEPLSESEKQGLAYHHRKAALNLEILECIEVKKYLEGVQLILPLIDELVTTSNGHLSYPDEDLEVFINFLALATLAKRNINISQYNSFIHKNQNDYNLLYNLANYYLALGDFNEAETTLKLAMDISSIEKADLILLKAQLGYLYLRSDRREDALELFKSISKGDDCLSEEDSVRIQNNLQCSLIPDGEIGDSSNLFYRQILEYRKLFQVKMKAALKAELTRNYEMFRLASGQKPENAASIYLQSLFHLRKRSPFLVNHERCLQLPFKLALISVLHNVQNSTHSAKESLSLLLSLRKQVLDKKEYFYSFIIVGCIVTCYEDLGSPKEALAEIRNAAGYWRTQKELSIDKVAILKGHAILSLRYCCELSSSMKDIDLLKTNNIPSHNDEIYAIHHALKIASVQGAVDPVFTSKIKSEFSIDECLNFVITPKHTGDDHSVSQNKEPVKRTRRRRRYQAKCISDSIPDLDRWLPVRLRKSYKQSKSSKKSAKNRMKKNTQGTART